MGIPLSALRLFICCFKCGVNMLLTTPPSDKLLYSQPPPRAFPQKGSGDALGTLEPRVLPVFIPAPLHQAPADLHSNSRPSCLGVWRGWKALPHCVLLRWGYSVHAPCARVCCTPVCTCVRVFTVYACMHVCWGAVSLAGVWMSSGAQRVCSACV